MFNLEKTEKALLIFLLAALLLGGGVIAYKKSCPVGNLRIETSGSEAEASGRDIPKKNRKININEASAGELMELKGVGKVLSGRIVEYRMRRGLFISPEDLKKVPGIGDKLFTKIKDDVSIE